jgi:hypothetical protein
MYIKIRGSISFRRNDLANARMCDHGVLDDFWNPLCIRLIYIFWFYSEHFGNVIGVIFAEVSCNFCFIFIRSFDEENFFFGLCEFSFSHVVWFYVLNSLYACCHIAFDESEDEFFEVAWFVGVCCEEDEHGN